ncbi:hypothetical protein ACIQYW_18535 [Rhodococcus erythropolis]|uniref:hypothetical protein n=2 Tax=Bacteria TaxID=2 RepID=UPI003395470F
MRQPSVGDVVHYQSYGTPGGEYLPEPRAAIVTEVEYVHDSEKLTGMYPSGEAMDRAVQWWDNGRGGAVPRRIDGGVIPMTYRVGLCVLNPTGMFFNTQLPYAEEPTPGHWNWPPSVEEPVEEFCELCNGTRNEAGTPYACRGCSGTGQATA